MIDVVHWGTGNAGRFALQGIIGHPELNLVGLHVARPERAGLDAGRLCDRPDTGVVATNDVAELLAVDADCLSYFGDGSHLAEVSRFLEAGRDVVTTSFAGLIIPNHADEDERGALDAAATTGGSSFFATGIEPGFASDLLPATLLSIVDELHKIHVQEIADYGDYGVPSVFKLWGFGNEPDEPIGIFQGSLLVDLWGGVARHLAEAVGVEVDDVRLVHESAVTDHDIETACGVVEKGRVAAIRFELQGMLGDTVFTVLEHVNYVDPLVAPQWCAGVTDTSTVYRVLISGRPNLTCDLTLPRLDGESHGLIATAMRAINAIPIVVDGPSGVLGPGDVPARASGHLRPGGVDLPQVKGPW